MRLKLFLVLIGGGLLLTRTVDAHHAFSAEFDSERPIELKGVVTMMEWTSPHAWIHIDVKNPDGSISKWEIEGSSPNALIRRGFSKQSLLPGTEIVVGGYQAKDRSNRANGRDITFPDGTKLFVGSSNTGAPQDGKDATEQKKK
jgi:hypothetical protein